MIVDDSLVFQEVDIFREHPELKPLIVECIDAARASGALHLRERFRPNPNAEAEVSETALDTLLTQGRQVSDIRSDSHISNCLVFHTTNLPGSVVDDHVRALRRRIDEVVIGVLQNAFGGAERVHVENSGHFWYPPGGYMSWHTNLRKPGWRMYLTNAQSPGMSFFRYREPKSGRIVTSMDHEWDCRLFQIRTDAPLWHAVYSQTDRFSFGYMVTPGQAVVQGR